MSGRARARGTRLQATAGVRLKSGPTGPGRASLGPAHRSSSRLRADGPVCQIPPTATLGEAASAADARQFARFHARRSVDEGRGAECGGDARCSGPEARDSVAYGRPGRNLTNSAVAAAAISPADAPVRLRRP